MNALGSEASIEGLSKDSAQPDRVAPELMRRIATAWSGEKVCVDVSECPDLFPALAVVAAASPGETTFTGTRRLRIKESDRAAAMEEVLDKFGVSASAGENDFAVKGVGGTLRGGSFSSFDDHRIAMAVAVGVTVASDEVEIDDIDCAAKSYPDFFDVFGRLRILV